VLVLVHENGYALTHAAFLHYITYTEDHEDSSLRVLLDMATDKLSDLNGIKRLKQAGPHA